MKSYTSKIYIPTDDFSLNDFEYLLHNSYDLRTANKNELQTILKGLKSLLEVYKTDSNSTYPYHLKRFINKVKNLL